MLESGDVDPKVARRWGIETLILVGDMDLDALRNVVAVVKQLGLLEADCGRLVRNVMRVRRKRSLLITHLSLIIIPGLIGKTFYSHRFGQFGSVRNGGLRCRLYWNILHHRNRLFALQIFIEIRILRRRNNRSRIGDGSTGSVDR